MNLNFVGYVISLIVFLRVCVCVIVWIVKLLENVTVMNMMQLVCLFLARHIAHFLSYWWSFLGILINKILNVMT